MFIQTLACSWACGNNMDATVMFLFVDSRSDFIQNLLLHQNIPETTRLHIYLLVNKVNDNKKKLLYLIWITLHGQQLTIREFIKQQFTFICHVSTSKSTNRVPKCLQIFWVVVPTWRDVHVIFAAHFWDYSVDTLMRDSSWWFLWLTLAYKLSHRSILQSEAGDSSSTPEPSSWDHIQMKR